MSDDRRADARLADRIRSGDTEALGELYDRYASTAIATALRVVGSREEAYIGLIVPEGSFRRG